MHLFNLQELSHLNICNPFTKLGADIKATIKLSGQAEQSPFFDPMSY
jgi:hypothetical protein